MLHPIKDEYNIRLIAAQLDRLFHNQFAFIDNDTFMFHVYCMCEKEDCHWCANMDSWEIERRNEKGSIWEQGYNAPNFWHKFSGMRVWWYKHIGRSTEILMIRPTDNINAIFLDVEAKILGKKLLRISYEYNLKEK